MKRKILIGIQPTGRLHIGNYLGVIKKGIELQSEYDVEFMVAIYHAYTSCNSLIAKRNSTRLCNHLIKLGATSVKVQSIRSLKLYWELLAQEPLAPLTHMPQYKSKEQTVGMLTYPILMAADIIDSHCDIVLVGDDQEAHMEYYRQLARKHGLPVAEMMKSECPKIMSIKDPTKKMSKSLGDEHCIYLDDTLEDMVSKIKKAPTDFAGLNNLVMISDSFGYKFDTESCAKSKLELSEVICNHFN